MVKAQVRDMYPAELFLPDGSVVLKGRVRIEADGRVRVWDVYQQTPRLRLDTRIVLDDGGGTRPVLIGNTPEGRLVVTMVGGCECAGSYVLRRIPEVPVF